VYFVYHRGGAKPPGASLLWELQERVNSVLNRHRGFADGKPLHIFISDVSVKLAGSDKWMRAMAHHGNCKMYAFDEANVELDFGRKTFIRPPAEYRRPPPQQAGRSGRGAR
jgi:hypothetical protein